MNSSLHPEELKKYYDAMPLAFSIVELVMNQDHQPEDFIFRYVNPAMAQLGEKALEQWIDRRYYQDITPDNNAKKWLSFLYQAAFQGKTQELHEYLPRLNKHIKIIAYPWLERGFCVCIMSDETALVQAQQNLNHLATFDVETNLYNKNSYMKLCRRRDFSAPCGVIFVDINGLKECNDLYGHHTGDSLIRQVALELTTALDRFQWEIYRIGGDEFVAFLENCTREQVVEKAETIRAAFRQPAFPFQRENVAAVGYGWAERVDSIQSLVCLADENMYAEKQQYYQQRLPRNPS